MGIRDILVIGFFMANTPICFFRAFYGVLLWTIVAFLNPHRFSWGAQNAPIAQAVGVATLAGLIFFHHDWRNIRSREAYLIIALQIWFTVTSLAAGSNPMFVHHIDDTWFRWQFVSKVLLMTIITIVVVNTMSRLRILLLVIAGCFGILVLKAVPFLIMTRGQFRLYGPGSTMIGDNNDFGLALNMTLPIFFFLARVETKPWLKRLFTFLVIATIPAVFCTYSRGALVGLVTVMTLMFLQLKERWVLLPVIVLGLAIVVTVAPDKWKERMDPTREGAIDSSAQNRLRAWTYATNLALDNPVTGGGFATFTRELFSRYAPPGAVIIGAHSVYFGLLAEHGFTGLGLYLALVVSCFLTTARLRRRAYYYDDMRIVHYVNMFRFSLTGFLLSGCFLGRAYFDYFFAIVACVAILNRVAQDEWAQREEECEEEEPVSVAGWRVSHA